MDTDNLKSEVVAALIADDGDGILAKRVAFALAELANSNSVATFDRDPQGRTTRLELHDQETGELQVTITPTRGPDGFMIGALIQRFEEMH